MIGEITQYLGVATWTVAGRITVSEKRSISSAYLVAGPERLGYETPLWTCPRVAHLIEQEFNVRYHEGHVWKILVGLGWSPQRPEGRARERNGEQILHWKQKVWPGLKKSAPGRADPRLHRGKRTESATASLPYLGTSRTAPLLQHNFNCKSRSVAAGRTWWNFYLRIYAGTSK
jgi:transposase